MWSVDMRGSLADSTGEGEGDDGGRGEVQASVARCLRTPPSTAKLKDLFSDLQTAYAACATGA